MYKEINLDGIYIAPFAGDLMLAILIFLPIRALFDQLHADQWVWHRPLFDASIFVIILSLVGFFFL
jgi:hypothetical protein